ncbi:DUF1488 family protein [Polaromonas jejuensis]|uniref:DUF1488 family protein n=1 Tax=Polaromonas jejuensis TaxID=457502 RepID=A0ABW0Q9U6_9BURK|nr:DUF1488 family protein [Polaromonas jejuensis]
MPSAEFLDTYDVVQFSIYPGGERLICWISLEALEAPFGATRESAVETLLANLDRIAPIAEEVYRATSPGDGILVTNAHF